MSLFLEQCNLTLLHRDGRLCLFLEQSSLTL